MAERLFSERVPEAAARQLAVVLAWMTECELATLEHLEGIKRTPKHELERHREICRTAVFHCYDLGVNPRGLRGLKCQRLEDELLAYPQPEKNA